MLLSVGKEDDASKLHVHRSGKKCWCYQDQNSLDGVGWDAEVGSFLAGFGTLEESDELL